MKLFCILFIAIIILTGCQVQPRYRYDEARRPDNNERQKERPLNYTYKKDDYGLSTFDLLRLGRIIESYLGKPYKGSSNFEEGLDCSQLVIEIYDRFNKKKLPRTVRKQFQTGKRISRQKMQFGDMVFFRTNGNKISHVGIYIENDEFVHASSSRGVIISSINSDFWEKRFAGCRRILP
jgi:hypothetical protein